MTFFLNLASHPLTNFYHCPSVLEDTKDAFQGFIGDTLANAPDIDLEGFDFAANAQALADSLIDSIVVDANVDIEASFGL